MADERALILVAIGGALGANARYLVSTWSAGRFGAQFPYGTLIVNLTGSLVLGFLAVVTTRIAFGHDIQLLISIGFIGAYTTFSTFAFESFGLIRRHAYALATANVVGSVVVGLTLAWIGMTVGR